MIHTLDISNLGHYIKDFTQITFFTKLEQRIQMYVVFAKKKKTQMNTCSFSVRSPTQFGQTFNPGFRILALRGIQSQMKKKILGDFICSYWVNAIILNTKKCIFIAKIREIKPTLYKIQCKEYAQL